SASAGFKSKPKDDTHASTLRHTAERRLSHRHNAPESFNLLVAGRRGVGKSTILQTICDSFHTLQIQSLTEGDKTIYTQPSATHKDTVIVAEAMLDPFCVFDTLSGTTQIRRCRVQLQDQDHETPLCVELVDTPGIDSDGSVNEISWEIERRLQNTLDDEMRPRREKSFHSAHIHAVIYVIPPPVYSSSETDSHCHRVDTAMDVISEIDIQAIRALGQFTSVLLAIGKSDTMEKSDRQVLKHTTYRFYSQVNELIMPTKLFDFTDIPGTQRESPEEVRVFGRRILREMPLFICGSKHVEEWQKMRLPEYLKTEEGGRSPGRGCVADWRSLGSKHNRVRSRSVMITEGIFRNRKSSNPTPILLPADDTQLPEKNSSNEESISPYAPMATRLSQSLVMRSDTVSIQRYDQKREISLVR
ncbi:Cell division control protein 11, partial [Kickxella alabastrina]